MIKGNIVYTMHSVHHLIEVSSSNAVMGTNVVSLSLFLLYSFGVNSFRNSMRNFWQKVMDMNSAVSTCTV